MHKYNAHGATDITGFGLLGHAKNLAKIQKNEVSFVIHNLPIIAKMASISKACGNMFGLLQGHSAETSGNPLISKACGNKFHLLLEHVADTSGNILSIKHVAFAILQEHHTEMFRNMHVLKS